MAEETDWQARRAAAIAAVKHPAVGATLERLCHLRVGDVGVQAGKIRGVALAVVDDTRAVGSWVALIRWWDPSRERYSWFAHDALDFDASIGGEMALRVVEATR